MIKMKLLGKHGKAPALWYDVEGYLTTLTELGEIFKINHVTLRARLKSGWNLSNACLVQGSQGWTNKELHKFINGNDLDGEFIKKLRTHFARPTPADFI